MPSNLWLWIHRVSWWLEDADERQTVLGDIQECGVNFTALRDLIGLVLLRQLQAWLSWRPWTLGALLFFPVTGLATIPVLWARMADYVSSPIMTDPRMLSLVALISVLMILNAYAIGFTVGALAKKTLLTMLPLVAALLLVPSVLLWNRLIYGLAAFVVLIIASTLMVVVPLTLGVIQGVRGAQLRKTVAMGLALLSVSILIKGYLLGRLLLQDGRYGIVEASFFINTFACWPIVYTLTARRHPVREVSYAQ